MSETETRAVHTDALHTLGTIIGSGEKRDAIHLAVEPAEAGELVHAGQHVGRMEDGRWGGSAIRHLGIVDPFIRGSINKGQHFWLVIYPRQITSLRHVWAHPDFAEDATSVPMSESQKWIEAFAEKLNQTYGRLMDAAEDFMETGKETLDNTEAYKDHDEEFPEFWVHYAIVTGETVPDYKRENFFYCSC